jgi:type II secretory pathway pseudopilin PulG
MHPMADGRGVIPVRQRTSRLAQRSAGGWSLLEVLTVVALTSVLAGTAVLSHQAARPMLDLSMAARQVAMDLRLARMRAIGDGANYRLVFAAGGASYQKQRFDGTAYVDDGLPVPLPRGVVIASCSASDGTVTFRARGNAGTFGTVTIQHSNGDVRRVVVNMTGRVRLQ